ncbi:adenine deaminase [Ignavibacteria bacterium]|nr:adenine deaminase [Bacteroidota bacterium]MCZ2133075.1 adenine deaminase [Bacteroidota bacterium]
MSVILEGTVFDVVAGKTFRGRIKIEDGLIGPVEEDASVPPQPVIMPGLVDAHVHIESSMLIPSEFARLATPHGTVATVSDPHEIANILGVEGVRYMVENGRQTPFKFCFGAPSCVPATAFETAGAEVTSEDIREMFKSGLTSYLSEMMNFPGVLNADSAVMSKIAVAKEFGVPIDGHAPGLRGDAVRRYAKAGITTDHECFSIEEASDKIACDMNIIIREGSAARNFDALHRLIGLYPERCMFCSDDKHPDSLVAGHINEIVRRAIELGYNPMNVVRMATLNPALHYKLPIGLLRTGDTADCIVVESLETMRVMQTYIDGKLVAENGQTYIERVQATEINNFSAQEITPEQIEVPAQGSVLRVIEVLDGQLITNELLLPARIENGYVVGDTENDVLKLAVLNRYSVNSPAIAFIRNFGLKRGSIASSVAHDSHNIIAVGTNDDEICAAINAIVKTKGGISVADNGRIDVLPLPVAGIMSAEDGQEVARRYAFLDNRAKQLGTELGAPFMTLSFMALLVIPALKLSDRGLFDCTKFDFTGIFAE